MGRRRLAEDGEADVMKESHPGSDNEQPVDIRPIGEVIKRSNKGKAERRHYQAVELDAARYDLEDAVLVAPEQRGEKSSVAIIKKIKPGKDGAVPVTDARCKICGEREVGVKDIIHVVYGDKYQLECLKCGNSWYASRDSVSSVTTDDQVSISPVGLAPLATSKFDLVEKELHSPREFKRPQGAQESLSSPQTKLEKVEETPAPESHYVEVEKMLTEHISLSGPGLSRQEQSKMDGEPTSGFRKRITSPLLNWMSQTGNLED